MQTHSPQLLKVEGRTGLGRALGIVTVTISNGSTDLLDLQVRVLSQEDKSPSCVKSRKWDARKH